MRMRMNSSRARRRAGGAPAAEPEKVWQAEGLDGLESAVLDSGEGVLYVSNINGDASAGRNPDDDGRHGRCLQGSSRRVISG
jgi:hypothetical protein